MSDPVALHVFRFRLDFEEVSLAPGASPAPVPLGGGAFAEVSGLEATVEPKEIREGGRNWGAVQRAGPVTFGTVVLRRGIGRASDLWRWFELVAGGAYAHRVSAVITLLDAAGADVFAWRLVRALPVRFKAADLDARSNDVGIEELHLVHEGLERVE